jgi:hypothetical protein
MAVKRDIKYLNRDFNQFRDTLIDFTKTYYPNTYTDFSPNSPGMMFLEMASYVGDVLSFYLDNQIQENFLQFARQENNLYQLAYMFGYKPRISTAASVNATISQLVPSTVVNGEYQPDFTYALYIKENATLSSTDTTYQSFLVQDSVDFSVNTDLDPTEVVVAAVDSLGNPTYYTLTKTRQAISATITEKQYPFGPPQKYPTVTLEAGSFLGILDCYDSDTNQWYEVDYLAQDFVFDSIKNTSTPQTGTDTPYLLKLKSVDRRFVTRIVDNNTIEIQFGAGISSDVDEVVVPNADNVGLGLPYGQSKLTTAYDPTNFIFTKTYGIPPSNTTLTFRYLTGGGVEANIPANQLSQITGTITFINQTVANNVTAQSVVFPSLRVNNPLAAEGGSSGDSIEDLRLNTISNFRSQLRNVTQDDYTVRALSLPGKFGTIAKVYVEPSKLTDINIGEIPSVLDLYVLTYDIDRTLKVASGLLKNNLITYLSQYRMIGDTVRIKDAFIINIGVDFDIITRPNYNSDEVISRCITQLQAYFDIQNWQINQPIVLRELYTLLDKVEGVQTVKTISINNKVSNTGEYSQYAYNIQGATKDNVIYPSLDPSIFEVKYLDSDIRGRVVNL